jgi:hypothetical protein
MRRRRILAFCIGFLAIGAAGSASAGFLGFQGSLSVTINNPTLDGIFPPFVVAGSGAALVTDDGNLHLLSFVLPSAVFGPATVVLPDTGWPVTGISSVRLTLNKNLTGNFSGISGGPPGGGPMGLSGIAKICLIFAPSCAVSVPFPLTPTSGGAGFGIGGTRTATGAVSATLQDAPWTIGQPVMTVHTPASSVMSLALPGGFAHGPASNTSSTAQPGGALQLVTVSKVFTSLTGAFPELPLTGILTLHFVPEAGTLLLLGTGAVVLAILGRQHRR